MNPFNNQTCPDCGSASIEGEEVDIWSNNQARQGCTCLDCEATWVDIYELKHRERALSV